MVGVVYVNVCVRGTYLEEELTWAIGQWFLVISNTMLFKTVIPLRI